MSEDVDDVSSDCDDRYDAAVERAMEVVFEYPEYDDIPPEFTQSKEMFDEFAEMLTAWWGEDGFFAEYWDRFPGDDDFRELGATKPWTPATFTDFFNYGFSESTWVAYRKKHSIMRNLREEALGIDRRYPRRSSERRPPGRRSTSPDRPERVAPQRKTSGVTSRGN